MRPHGLVSQFLNKYIHNSIEDTWCIEEFFVHNLGFIWFLGFKEIKKVKCKILEDSHIMLFVLDHLCLDERIFHVSNFGVVNFSLRRCSHSSHVIGDSKPFFSSLNAVPVLFAFFVLFLVVATIHHVAGEYTLSLGFCKDSVPANV